MRPWCFLILLPFLWLHCRSNYTPDNLPPDRLHFGSGGGVSGQVREYVLLLDGGQILDMGGQMESIGRLRSEELAELRRLIDEADFSATSQPGNMTSFLVLHDGTAPAPLSLRWPSGGEAPPGAQELYDRLLEHVRAMRQS